MTRIEGQRLQEEVQCTRPPALQRQGEIVSGEKVLLDFRLPWGPTLLPLFARQGGGLVDTQGSILLLPFLLKYLAGHQGDSVTSNVSGQH